MKYFIFLLFITFKTIVLFADDYPAGAAQRGMSNAAVVLPGLWSISHNQAGMAKIEKISTGIFFENRFFVKEMSLKTVAFALPTKTGTFGLYYSNFGYTKYSESKFALSYAKQLGKYISVGISLDYLYFRITEDYGSKGIAVSEIGIQAEPVTNFLIGAHVYNPLLATLKNKETDQIPTIFKLGMGYRFSEKVVLTIETQKELNSEILFKGGLQFMAMKNFYLRTGFSTQPNSYSFGLGYELKGLEIDFAVYNQPLLEYTPCVSLNYKFK